MENKNQVLLSDEQKNLIENQPLFELFSMELGGKDICFVKTQHGLQAFLNRCPHAATKLSEGKCNKKGVVSCHLHGYKFDTNTGKDVDGNGYRLITYPVTVQENEISILFKHK